MGASPSTLPDAEVKVVGLVLRLARPSKWAYISAPPESQPHTQRLRGWLGPFRAFCGGSSMKLGDSAAGQLTSEVASHLCEHPSVGGTEVPRQPLDPTRSSGGPATPDLVRRARAGHQAAIDELFACYERVVLRWALWITWNREDAEDLAMDVLVRALKNLPELREPSGFHSWIWRILENRVREIHRNSSRWAVESLDDMEVAVADDMTARLIVWCAVEELPLQQRDAVVGFYFEGKTLKEVALALCVSKNTVINRLNSARNQLRHSLALDSDIAD